MSSLTDIQAQFAETSYAITGLIGQGAMGTVYRGEHRRLHRPVAIKVLATQLDSSAEERFRLEAQASARLRHDHIVAVTDCDTLPDGRPYLVMELLDGVGLAAHVERRGGHLPVKETCAIARQIPAALAYAHDQGIVHRDIKPANIIVCDSGRIKLLDFGVAKLTAKLTGVMPLAAPTAEGMAVGTPRYMAPEQARGGAIDGRADLYAVGVVMYWMLTGAVPFAEHDQMGDLLLAKCAEVPPPPSDRAPQTIAPQLDQLVLRALAIEPSQRFANAYAMAGAIIQLGTAYRKLASELGFAGLEELVEQPAARAVEEPVGEPVVERTVHAEHDSRDVGETTRRPSDPAQTSFLPPPLARPADEHGEPVATGPAPGWRDLVGPAALGFVLALAISILAQVGG